MTTIKLKCSITILLKQLLFNSNHSQQKCNVRAILFGSLLSNTATTQPSIPLRSPGETQTHYW